MKIVRKNNGRNHWYIDVDAGGQRVPGVTTLCGEGMPKPALLNWAADSTADYAVDNWDTLASLPLSERLKKIRGGRYEKRDAAANRGSQIHKLAERLIADERVTVPDELTGYVQACVRFLDDFQIRPVYVEAVVYSETRRHVGTLDLIADVLLPDMPEYDHIHRDGDGFSRGLLDWKTSRSGIFGDVAMQLAPYRYSEFLIDPAGDDDDDPIDMPLVDFCAGIHLRPDGYSFVPLACGEQQYRDFLYIKEVARIVGDLRDLVGEPIVPPTASRYQLCKAEEFDA